MKNCELCKLPARAHCESDEASLCWDCDGKVHGANFLVARHSRTLLCHLCQSLTPWNASGAKLGHTISICESCIHEKDRVDGEENEAGNDDDDDDEIDTEDDDDQEEEDGENQVVPLSTTATQPPAASPTSSEESVISRFSLKRMRPNASDLPSQDDLNCSSAEQNNGSPFTTHITRSRPDGEVNSVDSTRPLKDRRTEQDPAIQVLLPAGSKSVAIIESVKKVHQRDKDNLNQATEAVDFNSSGSSAV